MESDAFDDLNAPMLLSSGDGLVYGTDYVYRVRYRNSAGTLKWVNAVYTGGFYRFSPPASGYYPDLLYAQVYKSGLPKTSATYGVTATFLQGNMDFGEYVTSGFCEVYESAQNVTESNFATTGLSYTNTGESYVVKGNVKLTRTSIRVNIGLALKKGVNTTFDISDLSFDFYFKNNADIPVSGNTGYDSSDVVADNTAQMVEKQDTIIDQIVNVTQTISSQLTAFWNQLAGEFTNLYNKMNTQHTEQLEADRTNTDDIITADDANTDKVTGAIEKHGNFIIEGLKSLFIPSDDYFKTWFDGMYQFFNDRLGFLMLPVDLLVRMADMYASAGTASAGIPFPEFKWVDGTVIIPGQIVQFDFLNTDWGKGIQDKLYFVGNLIMIGALLSLMHRKFEEVLRN
ncbi:hypothetical protein [Enterocloster citroniae]|uniref:DUF2479 domain-containing protein n=2 Tax=Enterocloster citroniae TaxID=358743 RepID=A0ABV2FUT4_9FIRM|nr:hypothetical protein [Enterocloster citroniae]